MTPWRKRWGRRLKRAAIGAVVVAALGAVAFTVAWHALPFPIERLDAQPVSPVVTDRTGRTILQLTGRDEHWRLPVATDRISPWLRQATIAVEDKRFDDHIGVDVAALARASWQNVSAGRVVSGASTLTMQLVRMTDPRPRTLWAKGVEAFRAMQIESLRSKDQLLLAYLNMAPYGGNLRGAEAAAMAYFGKHAADLSLGESALLAGLPQSPSRLRPDRHGEAAIARRRHVLDRMLEEGTITADQHRSAADEPLALSPYRPAEVDAFHVAQLALAQRPAGGTTTIDLDLQRHVARLAKAQAATLPRGTEVSVVVLDIASGHILALLGSTDPGNPVSGQVCGATAWRSPGSALKPFVYAAAFEAGRADPHSTVYDVPIQRGGWSPRNFGGSFEGTLTAADALRQSRNVPAILVAEQVGLARCTGLMQAAGVTFRAPAAQRGGLAAVVGAVEVRLIDLTNAYATIGRGGVRKPVRLFGDAPTIATAAMNANVCAALDDILSTRQRTPANMTDRPADAVPWFMWKTGTSSGRRDAWAVGHNHRVAVGVWVGRFSGGGNYQYVGAQAAEPLLARLMDLPAVRTTDAPPPHRPWVVMAPLPKPPEVAGTVKILQPAGGTTFLAMDGLAIVNVKASRTRGLYWFLNGRLLSPADASRLVLPPGHYELRCATDTAQAAAVRFKVQ